MWRLFILLLLAGLSGCTNGRLLRYGIPDVRDHKIFPAAKIEKADEPFLFAKATTPVTLPPPSLWACGKSVPGNYTAEQFLEANDCLAFIIIRNDSILYEQYFNGHGRESISQVFSVTKAFMSTLVGIAISEGKMSMDQPVSDFLPYFADGGMKAKITINHLLQMTSGLKFNDYHTLGKLLNLYYTADQEKILEKAKVKWEPGTHFAYSSLATQALGMCLEKATGMKGAEYLQQKLWNPLGMEFNAQLALDHKNNDPRFYGGIATTAIDLAKLGRLFLNKGNWNGTQVVPEEWALSSRKRNETNGSSWEYTNCWWLDTYSGVRAGKEKDDFFAGGYRGQIVYVNPEDNTIMIRVGTSENGVNWPYTMSKLALFPFGETDNVMNEELISSLSGKYKNKAGKDIAITFDHDRAIINNLSSEGALELIKDSGFSFANKKKGIKLIANYKNQHINGFLFEAGDHTEFFQKETN